jgi:hypothetical protein
VDGLAWLSADGIEGCSDRERAPALFIDQPAAGAILLAGSRASVELSASYSGSGPMPVEFVLDGVVVATAAGPYRAEVEARPGDHELIVRPVNPAKSVAVAFRRFSVR